jgi:hypothetical protein
MDSYLFEDRSDPLLIVTVARWSSRAAFETLYNNLGLIGGAGMYEGTPAFSVCRPILRYVQMFAPSAIATLTMVEGPLERATELREFLVSTRKGMDLREYGIVEHEIGEDEDRPGRFSLFVRWRTSAAVPAGRAAISDWFDPAVASFGATLRRYDGVVRAEMPLYVPVSGGAAGR